MIYCDILQLSLTGKAAMSELVEIDPEKEVVEDLLHGRMKIIQKRRGYRFSMDAVLLADFVKVRKGCRIVDLGTGCGVIPLILSQKNPLSEMVGIEIDRETADMARRSVELNGLSDRISIVHGDIKRVRSLFPPESFGVAVANPPYGVLRTGRISPKAGRAESRHEISAELDDFISAAFYLVKYGGRLSIVYPARRLVDLVCRFRNGGFEPKRLRPVYSRESGSAELVLLEGIKGGGIEMEVMSPLYIYGEDGRFTPEMEKMYR